MKEIVPVFAWATSMHIIYWIAFQLSAYLLGPVIGLFFSDYTILLLALTLFSTITIKLNAENAKSREQLNLLLFAAAEGAYFYQAISIVKDEI